MSRLVSQLSFTGQLSDRFDIYVALMWCLKQSDAIYSLPQTFWTFANCHGDGEGASAIVRQMLGQMTNCRLFGSLCPKSKPFAKPNQIKNQKGESERVRSIAFLAQSSVGGSSVLRVLTRLGQQSRQAGLEELAMFEETSTSNARAYGACSPKKVHTHVRIWPSENEDESVV